MVTEAGPNCRCVVPPPIPLAHFLTPLEMRLACIHLGVDRDAIGWHQSAAIIGEAPGRNTSPKLPLFPFPASSAGGRLMAYSGMKPTNYLATFHRRNVQTVLAPWSAPHARELATYIERDMVDAKIHRVLLLGTRVGAAFEVGGLWSTLTTTSGITYFVIPHPSGRCRVYNDEPARARARAALRWAAGLRQRMP